jgi:serine/threonine protein kinase
LATLNNQPLPDGYQLQGYRIERLLSSGGFSLVYLACDDRGERVAIKEYLPSALALRKQGDVVPAIPEENLAVFRYGMKCFFEEGRSLARLSHPNVVRVLNFFRANETVYLVMRYEQGRTLQQDIARNRGNLRENYIRRVITLMLNGLREVHTSKLLHLDLKPANIYVRTDDSPVLLDFGAARQTLTEAQNQLNPMYTPGYAPPEQYRQRDLLGPWSDLYSVGAAMYACISGQAPPPADQRVEQDRYVPAVSQFARQYSVHFLETIDWCLQVDHLRRPQSALALQKVLLRERDPQVAGRRTFIVGLRGTLARLSRTLQES